jgi:hypothetical protein
MTELIGEQPHTLHLVSRKEFYSNPLQKSSKTAPFPPHKNRSPSKGQVLS